MIDSKEINAIQRYAFCTQLSGTVNKIVWYNYISYGCQMFYL